MEDIGSMIDNETDRINLGIPSQYNTRVADLGEMQNKILVSFLKHESVANNSNPSINLYEALKKRKESTGTTKGAFGKVAYNTKFLSALNNIPQGAFLDFGTSF